MFDLIKKYLACTTVLVLPDGSEPLKLYLSITEDSIGCFLAQDNEEGNERLSIT